MKPALLQQVVRFHGYGGADRLVTDTMACPEPAEQEVLVRIIAAGVNPIDWKLREGFKQVLLPYTPGVEAAGIITALGQAVQDFEVGQAVYGAIDHSYAELAIARPESVFLKPAHLSFAEAAAVGGGKTAWGALFEVGHLRKGQRILINGAAGVFAVQLAHLVGAHVIATASAENFATLKSLGADEVIDYKTTPFERVVRDLDVVLDAVGGQTLEASYQVLKAGGTLLALVEPPKTEKAAHFGVSALWGGTKTSSSMREVDALLQRGALRPVVRKVFSSLAQAAQAQDYSQKGGQGIGKIVLQVAAES
jgi:NADPH:quinone reductase-like Zn-dependent oxidoreductase